MKKASLFLSTVLLSALMVASCEGNASKESVDQERLQKTERTDSAEKGENTSIAIPNYKNVTIGKQVWMTENLNVEKFRNGDIILQARTVEEWKKAGESKQPAWCFYDNDSTKGEKYGKLYNWYAVNDPRGLAPEGWNIPSNEDWIQLISFLGGENVSGKKMKFTDFWQDNKGESGNGTNESGFEGLPGGARGSKGGFINFGYNGFWWSSTECSTLEARGPVLGCLEDAVALSNEHSKRGGLSVRCLKN